jgi:hypothetical protein
VKNLITILISFVLFAQTFATFAVKKKLTSLLRLLPFTFILFFAESAFSQEIKVSEVIITIAEQLAAAESEPDAVALYIERLHELAEEPVLLNSGTEEEISRLFFLSDFQIKAAADYIQSSGRVVSVYELANIPGFDRETVEWMIPFISLETVPLFNTDSVRWHNNLITSIYYKPGTQEPSYVGSPLKVLTKYRFNAGSFSGGLTAEKDPGEKLLYGSPPVPDFLSAHLSYIGPGIIRKVVIGDYSARFGLGTNISSGLRNGMALTSPGFISSRNEIKPYTSSDENSLFRGFSALLFYKFIEMTLFYSVNKTDATLNQTDTSSQYTVKTLISGGIHNTLSALNKKDNVTDETFGINVAGNYRNLRIGLTWSQDVFSVPLKKDISKPESLFDFEGKSNNLYSIYYNGLIKRNLFFGEISVNDNNNYALVQGLSLRPANRLSVSLIYRKYDRGYYTFHGKGPGVASETKNEQGIAAVFSFEAAKHLFLSGGFDVQSYEWLRYRCSAPSRGVRNELRLRYEATPSLTIDASYQYRQVMEDTDGLSVVKTQTEILTRSARLSFRYMLNENLGLLTKFDYKWVQLSGSKGIAILQDVNYRFRKIPLSVWYRYCIFTTDNWDSRLYEYENDLLYSFSIPALSGKGSRSYIMAKWDINSFAEVRVKYSVTSLNKSLNTTEDLDEIRFQIRIFF